MRSILLFILACCLYDKVVMAQENREVLITTSGSGKTQEDARQYALRNAIEQAFGTFISSKTEILNDKIISDQISSISSGNIKSYEILTQSQLPNGTYYITIKATLSIDKLTSYFESKGVKVEFKGSIFALNIKQQELNEIGETSIIYDLVGNLHELMQNAFDFNMKTGNPKFNNDETNSWDIPITVNVIANKNIEFNADYILKTLSAVSLSRKEIETYQELNKNIFIVQITYKEETKIFYLRKFTSLEILSLLINQWEYYTSGFTISNNLRTYISKGMSEYYNFGKDCRDPWGDKVDNISINFPAIGDQVTRYNWNDRMSLSEIERISSYSINPNGTKSFFKYGGIVVGQIADKLLISSLFDLQLDWKSAQTLQISYSLGGFQDWKVPSYTELEMLNQHLFLKNLGSFLPCLYLSSTTTQDKNFLGFVFKGGCEVFYQGKHIIPIGEPNRYLTRFVRTIPMLQTQ